MKIAGHPIAIALMSFVIVILGSALAGCANTRATQTGFLGAYDGIARPAQGSAAPRYTKAGAWSDGYTGFIIDPVVYQPTIGVKPLRPEAVTLLTSDYREKLTKAFAERLEPATDAGPGIVRVRAAITEAGRSNAVLNGVTLAVALVPVTAGGASTEAEVVDSVTGERLVALTGFNNGGRSFLGGPLGYLSRYGHARRAIAVQSRQLRDLIPAQPAPPSERR
jgi:hypothetical protein